MSHLVCSSCRIRRFGSTLASALVVALFATPPAAARIARVDITARESPTFGGYSWPGVGQYEKLVGKAYGEVDPKGPKNAVIVDMSGAPDRGR